MMKMGFDNKDRDIMTASEVIMDVVNEKIQTSSSNDSGIVSVWKNVVSKIKSPRRRRYEDNESEFYNNAEREFSEEADYDRIGLRLAHYTRVVDLKNNVLLVECEHPGWIQYLNFYKNFILRGLNQALPNMNIKNLAFRVKGSEGHLSATYEQAVRNARAKLRETMEFNEKEVEAICPSPEKKVIGKLPPEIIAKFDSIKQDMLTKSKNT